MPSLALATATARCCWNARRTGCAGTRRATGTCTGRGTKSKRGDNAIRSRASRTKRSHTVACPAPTLQRWRRRRGPRSTARSSLPRQVPNPILRNCFATSMPEATAANDAHEHAVDSAAEARPLSYAEAIREALAQAMEADARVFLFGEDVGVYGGAFGVSGDLLRRFGPQRVIDTPISELSLAGAAVGAALTGMKPVLEIQFSDFVTLAMEQLVNQAAKIRFMFGGKASVPMVVRLPGGSGTGAAAQHSQSLEAWFAHVPGLKVVQPSTPHDAKGLLLAAIDDPNPVLVFEHKLLYKMKGPVPREPFRVPLGKAAMRREGHDVTIVGTSIMTVRALAAAERLAADGIDAEVIDLRSLRPLDSATIFASVRKT